MPVQHGHRSRLKYLLVHYAVPRPTITDLINLKRKDGSRKELQIIDWITAHKSAKCDDFAQMLLNDPVTVMKLRKRHSDDDEFVRAAFNKWLSRDDDNEEEDSIPCTWEALIKCVDKAGLNRDLLKELSNNVPMGGECNLLEKGTTSLYQHIEAISQLEASIPNNNGSNIRRQVPT